jgi:hypothetical protein
MSSAGYLMVYVNCTAAVFAKPLVFKVGSMTPQAVTPCFIRATGLQQKISGATHRNFTALIKYLKFKIK